MPKQTFDLHELMQHVLLEIHAAWRFRWHALAAAWCVAVIGALMVFALPAKYEADAQVYADTNALTNPLLRGIAVQSDVRGRLDVITHTLLSRPNLETVADKTGLGLRATAPADKDELLAKLGNAVKVRDAGAKNLYNIVYTDTDPQMAQKVVQAFLEILMNETLGANSSTTQTARNFLQQQVDDYTRRLDAADTKMANFRKANMAYLPTKGGEDYFSELQTAEAQLQSLKQQRAAAASGRRVVSQPTVDPAAERIDAQISAYKKQLDNLLLTYTDAYPDVVNTRRVIRQLEERRAALQGGSSSVPGTTVRVSKSQVHALDARIAAQQGRIADLKAKANKAADVQTRLQQMARDYATTRKQYDELVSRLNQAQMSQAATQSGNNLKFRVVNPPVVPLLPVSPKRGLLLLVVLVFALGIGVGFAYFMHKIRPVFTSLRSLRGFSDYPVIGTISMVMPQLRRMARRREIFGFFTGIGLLVLVMAAGFAYDAHLSRLVQHVFVMGAS